MELLMRVTPLSPHPDLPFYVLVSLLQSVDGFFVSLDGISKVDGSHRVCWRDDTDLVALYSSTASPKEHAHHGTKEHAKNKTVDRRNRYSVFRLHAV